jgi:hypothetical protein
MPKIKRSDTLEVRDTFWVLQEVCHSVTNKLYVTLVINMI